MGEWTPEIGDRLVFPRDVYMEVLDEHSVNIRVAWGSGAPMGKIFIVDLQSIAKSPDITIVKRTTNES